MKTSLKIAATLAMAIFSSSALAATCSNTSAGFNQFKRDFAQYARQNGVGSRGIEALNSTSYSQSVINFDRIQRKAFNKGFDEFYKLRTTGLTGPSKSRLKRYASAFASAEQQYGVPKEVVVTIWGMETAFGKFTGKHDVITSLATLVHDCRRSDFFRPHLLASLKILDNRWMTRQQMRGARHGEIGQTQFLAANYVRYGVDFDRDGRVDLINSIPDVIASTANYLRGHGWQPGQSYHPGTHNYNVLKEWNAASVYQQAIAKFAASLR